MPLLILGKSQRTWCTAYYLPLSMAGRKSWTFLEPGLPHPVTRDVTFCPAFRIKLFTGSVVRRYK